MAEKHRYFHRQFLADPEDDSTNAAVTARVANTDVEFPYLGAFVILSDGYDSVHLSFSASTKEEVDKSVQRAQLLKQIINKFADAVVAEGKVAKKSMK
jgi:hypothetical protein